MRPSSRGLFLLRVGMALLALLMGVISLMGCAPTLQQQALAIHYEDARYEPPTTAVMRDAVQGLEKRLIDAGITIVDAPEGFENEYWGTADMTTQTIMLPPGLSPDARFEVLLHEGAHLFQPPTLDRASREVFAEVVMVKAAKAYGWDAQARSARYLATWKAGFAALPFLSTDIAYAVDVLTGRLPMPQRWQ